MELIRAGQDLHHSADFEVPPEPNFRAVDGLSSQGSQKGIGHARTIGLPQGPIQRWTLDFVSDVMPATDLAGPCAKLRNSGPLF